MFCSQCLMSVGPRDRVCSVCGADLTAPGSVRLTDPRRISAGAQPAPGMPAAVPPAAAAQAGAAAGGQPPAAAEPETIAAESLDVEPAAAEPVEAEPVDAEPPVPPQATPTPAPAAAVPPTPASGARPADDGTTKASPRQPPKPRSDERLIPVTSEKDPRTFALWDDYGIAEAPEPRQVGPDASRREQVGQLVGANAVPTAKVLSAAAVLGVTVLVLIVLVGRLLTLDSLVVIRTGTPQPPASATVEAAPQATAQSEPSADRQEAEATSAPTTSSRPTPTKSPTPSKATPSMQAGAKECNPGVWAGSQTSCVLANEVGQQIDTAMTGSVTIEAFSSSSNRTYRLECVADKGISCTGLDGVEGLNVWIVAGQ